MQYERILCVIETYLCSRWYDYWACYGGFKVLIVIMGHFHRG